MHHTEINFQMIRVPNF